MCHPVAMGVASFAIGALQAVAGFMAEKEEKEANDAAAKASFEQDQVSLSLRQIQEQDAASQQQQIQEREGAEARAEVALQAAEGGVGGLSVENLRSDITRRMARNQQIIRDNTHATIEQVQLEKFGSRAGNQGRINSVPQPNVLGLVAGIAGAGINAFGSYNKYRMA